MAYNKTVWVDHIVDSETGEIIQQGTPISAGRLNNIELGILAENALGAFLVQETLQQKRALTDLEGESGQIALTNTQQYPFNNSTKTISLVKPRDTLNYTVKTEVISSNGGFVGKIEVYDKQLNGFKLRYTGSAAAATIKYIVQGGMYQ